jgi:cation diffusion facilitator family transporter
VIRTKRGAAALSIASNSILIAIKLAAGAVTGSIAILTEAIHSLIDLVASVVAFVSVRKADEPADESHPYGHEKVESLAATIEGMLILVGAGIIVFEAIHRLAVGAEVESLGFGIAVMAVSLVANLVVSTVLANRARIDQSPALAGDAAHLRTDALTSAGVLVGLALVKITGSTAFDSIAALAVAVAIVHAGYSIIRTSSGVLVDEALPAAELDRIEAAIAGARTEEVAGYHKLRARRAGRRRYIDLHVQFRSGTTLERAHELAHSMRDSIEGALPDAEVLIHVEPETSFRSPDQQRSGPFRAGEAGWASVRRAPMETAAG